MDEPEPYYHVGGCLALVQRILDGPRGHVSGGRLGFPYAMDSARRRAWLLDRMPKTYVLLELSGHL